jgi:hypothetical protein
MTRNGRFTFDGGAATYVGTALLGVLITVVTLGICYPFALVLKERWRAKHSYIDGHRLVFTGSAIGLFGLWIKWFLLSVVTLGIYLFWDRPADRCLEVGAHLFRPLLERRPGCDGTGAARPPRRLSARAGVNASGSGRREPRAGGGGSARQWHSRWEAG